MCRGVRLLKEQEIGSKCQRRNRTEHQQSIFNQQCRCREEIHGSCVRSAIVVFFALCCFDGGVARQQQLDDLNVTLRGGDVQGVPVAEGTGNQQQRSEAQHNTTSAVRFQSTMQG